jgi:DNA-binding PadR family transcriptional regulator
MTDIKGYFKIIALEKLNEREQTGYDLIQSIEDALDRKPSPGSIYPLLNNFLKNGYVTVRQEGRKKIYSITIEGKKALKNMFQEKEQLMIKSAEILKIFGSLSGQKEIKSINKLINQMKSKSELLLKNIDLWVDIKDAMVKLAVKPNYGQKQKRVRKILQETIKKLKKLQKED